ncbi:MAG TPA: hypothetical protein VK427_17105, partial [Kofleriaceae bacterium]|nr:hypothetical protein [Kofleriaceae bacterium]
IVIELPGRSLRLAGTPRRIVRPVEVLVQPVLVAELEAAVAALAIRAVPSSPATSIAGTISTSPPVVTVELATDNHCGVDERQIGGTDGPGCVAATQWAAIDAALAKLAAPPAQLADQRLVPIDPVTITLADGVVLDLQKRPRVGDRDADSTRVAELLAILQTPAGEPSARDPSAKVTGTITIADRAGTKIELALLANRTVARAGEPVAFDAGTVWTVLTRPSRELADPTLWTEDDTTIRTITVGATTYTRGAVVGEWTATPARAVDAERVSTFARALAQLRGSPGPRATMRHTISFEVVPPGGTPTRRTLQLGARTPAGCPAIVDGEALVLDAAVCDAAARL